MHGATVVVRRAGRYPVLRRVEFHDSGDWGWTPPAGVSEPGEAAYDTAVRELPLTVVADQVRGVA